MIGPSCAIGGDRRQQRQSEDSGEKEGGTASGEHDPARVLETTVARLLWNGEYFANGRPGLA